jgi:hypothetical protein
MSWALNYIASNYLTPIPFISSEIVDFPSEFLPKSMNFSNSIPNQLKPTCTPKIAGLYKNFWPRKNPNRLKPDLRPAKPSLPAKAGPAALLAPAPP